jgi:hypothetical protein
MNFIASPYGEPEMHESVPKAAVVPSRPIRLAQVAYMNTMYDMLKSPERYMGF